MFPQVYFGLARVFLLCDFQSVWHLADCVSGISRVAIIISVIECVVTTDYHNIDWGSYIFQNSALGKDTSFVHTVAVYSETPHSDTTLHSRLPTWNIKMKLYKTADKIRKGQITQILYYVFCLFVIVI